MASCKQNIVQRTHLIRVVLNDSEGAVPRTVTCVACTQQRRDKC